MQKIFKWSVVMVIVTLLATIALKDNGRMLMVWQDWVIETSLTFAVVMTILLLGLIYLMTRLWVFFINLPRNWRERNEIKRHNRAETTLSKGMIALEYGDWKMAEKQLIKSAQHSSAGLVHYLSAAKMANNQNAPERRDKYLQEARSQYPEDYEIIGLVEARLLKDKEPLKAKVILKTLLEQHPKNRAILAEMAHLLVQLNNWRELEAIMPNIKKSSALEKPDIQALEIKMIAGKVAHAEDCDALDTIWHTLSSKQQMRPEILVEFVEQRMGWGQQQGLASMIERSLKKDWYDRLVYQYGRIDFGPAFERLKIAERWLTKQPDNPVLLLTLGRLACMSQLWGVAHTYLKKSLELRPEIETFHALAKCYEAEGLESKAALTYKEAILQLEKKA